MPSTFAGNRVHATQAGTLYRMLWRWHFYASLLCIPFVLWLSLTGSIYLFRPQIQSLLNQPYDHIAKDKLTAADARVQAALAAVPGTVLDSYQLPLHADDATQILVGRGARQYRVYVQPSTLRVLKVVGEQDRPMRVLFHLHGELLLGDAGSVLVELAGAWAIVMLLTGLYLWWPRGRGLAGTLYPRLRKGHRTLWRDLHAVTGLWITGLAMFMLISGLPWTAAWGTLLKTVSQADRPVPVAQGWSTGSTSEAARHRAMSARPHSAATTGYRSINRMIPTVAALNLAPPVLISPPSAAHAHWTARSMAFNRPLRVDLTLNQHGRVIKRVNFDQRPLIDRMVGFGVAIHTGQFFGWLNKALALLTTSGLVLICISAIKLWWRRRPTGVLGAPAPGARRNVPLTVCLIICLLGVLIPVLGLSILLLLAVEKWLLRRWPTVRNFLGL